MSPPTGSPSSAQWHAVTPHTRPLSIAILELAPTSVTLALTRSPPVAFPQSQHLAPAQHSVSSHHSPLSHAAHSGPSSAACGSNHSIKRKKKKKPAGNVSYLDSDDGGEDDEDGLGTPGSLPSLLGEGQTFKDMLSHGVVVTLDGTAWSRIVAHVSDDPDDSEGAGMEDQEEEGEWEDESDPAGQDAEEAVGSTSGAAQPSARRRKGPHRSGQGRSQVGVSTMPSQARDRPERSHRWDRERAVVVVYDLDPSKEHEIELQIIGLSGEIKESSEWGVSSLTSVPVSNTVLIPPASPSSNSLHPRSRANSLRSRSTPRSRSNSFNTAAAVPVASSPLAGEPSSPGRSVSPLPDVAVIPTPILNPHDAQTAQTRHLIAAAHAERESLQLQIKEARKTAQRSEAALRTEIESMKKSNEKAASSDQRNKQKYLALQEQVKQAWAAAETAKEDTKGVKSGVPELEKRLAAVKADLDGVRGQWNGVKEEEEEAREVDRKHRAEEDKKLADIVNKIDKINNRKDHKEAERTELLKRLEDLERQRDDIERKADEEKNMRRQGYYPGVWQQAHGNYDHGRSLSSHPSMTNLGTSTAFNTSASFRPRGGGYQRFPSGGRPPQPVAQSNFFPASGDSSPSWSAPLPKPTQAAGSRGPSGGSGTNPGAQPFQPNHSPTLASNPPVSGNGVNFDSLHTALTPAQFQHRIYLPNSIRPRPGPNFHPPPSVLAEQAAQAAASTASSSSSASPVPASKPSPLSSQPAFPPLSTTALPIRPSGPGDNGPSLASIVTRAVLAPTSALAQPGQSAAPGAGRPQQQPSPQLFPRSGSPFGAPLSPTAAAFTSPHSQPIGTTPSPR